MSFAQLTFPLRKTEDASQIAFPQWYRRKQERDATVTSPDMFRKTCSNIYYSMIHTTLYIDYTINYIATEGK